VLSAHLIFECIDEQRKDATRRPSLRSRQPWQHAPDCRFKRRDLSRKDRARVTAEPQPYAPSIGRVRLPDEQMALFETVQDAGECALVQMDGANQLACSNARPLLDYSQNEPLRAGNPGASVEQLGGSPELVFDRPEQAHQFDDLAEVGPAVS
jgi:hypothetical protein